MDQQRHQQNPPPEGHHQQHDSGTQYQSLHQDTKENQNSTTHILQTPKWIVVVRALQGILALGVFILCAWLAKGSYSGVFGLGIFTALFTWIVLLYGTSEKIARLQRFYHILAVLCLDALMLIFYVSVWASNEALRNYFASACRSDGDDDDDDDDDKKTCGIYTRNRGFMRKYGKHGMIALTIFGVLIWILFIITFSWTLKQYIRGRKQNRFRRRSAAAKSTAPSSTIDNSQMHNMEQGNLQSGNLDQDHQDHRGQNNGNVYQNERYPHEDPASLQQQNPDQNQGNPQQDIRNLQQQQPSQQGYGNLQQVSNVSSEQNSPVYGAVAPNSVQANNIAPRRSQGSPQLEAYASSAHVQELSSERTSPQFNENLPPAHLQELASGDYGSQANNTPQIVELNAHDPTQNRQTLRAELPG